MLLLFSIFYFALMISSSSPFSSSFRSLLLSNFTPFETVFIPFLQLYTKLFCKFFVSFSYLFFFIFSAIPLKFSLVSYWNPTDSLGLNFSTVPLFYLKKMGYNWILLYRTRKTQNGKKINKANICLFLEVNTRVLQSY